MVFDERLIMKSEDNGDIIRNEHLVRYQFAAKFVNNKKVLDIACGSGYGTEILAAAGASEVVGIDLDTETVDKNNKNNSLKNIIYKKGDAANIPCQDKEFDIAVSFETIEHLPALDQEKFVSELVRVVSDDGLVFVSTPNCVVFKNKNPYHKKELTKSELEKILKKYFPFVVILEQENGIASFLKVSGAREITNVKVTSVSEPLYFVAICSHRALAEVKFRGEGIGSISVAAYNRLKNNPVLRISNKIYPIVKKIFNFQFSIFK